MREPARRGAVRAGGGAVVRGDGGDQEIALVHRPRYDDWSLPKGKLQGGEGWAVGALREVEEETGLYCALGPELQRVEYLDRKGRPKEVRYWLMAPISGEFEVNDEVDEVRWLPFEAARALASYEHDRELILAAAAATRSGWDEPGTPPARRGWRRRLQHTST